MGMTIWLGCFELVGYASLMRAWRAVLESVSYTELCYNSRLLYAVRDLNSELMLIRSRLGVLLVS